MRAIRKHLMRDRGLPSTAYDVMGYWRGATRRQPRAVDPGPIWRAGKAAGKSDEQIWAEYDEAREVDKRPAPEGFRSGFASFVGRPNAGKSTLTNALVGTKVVITATSRRPRGPWCAASCTATDAQLILVDTPGLHRPRTLLGERLNDLVQTTWAEVDVVAVCFPANEKIGPGDRFIVTELAKVQAHHQGRRRHQDRPRHARADRRAPARHPAARARDRHRLGRDRPGLRAVAATRSKLLEDLLVGLLPEGPAALPRRRPHRCAGGDARRRADPRGRPRRGPRRAAALDRRRGRGDGAARGPARGQAAARHPRQPLRRAVVAEGHRDRPQGRPPARRSAPPPGTRSRRCSARRSTSTCTSRSPRTGRRTHASCASWGSELLYWSVRAQQIERRLPAFHSASWNHV